MKNTNIAQRNEISKTRRLTSECVVKIIINVRESRLVPVCLGCRVHLPSCTQSAEQKHNNRLDQSESVPDLRAEIRLFQTRKREIER